MKRFKMFVLMLAIAALSVPALAESNVNIEPVEGKVLVKTAVDGKDLKLFLANLQKERTTVILESMDGDTKFYRGIIENHNGYIQGMDLSKLPNGRYNLKVKNVNQVYTKVLKIETNKVWVSK